MKNLVTITNGRPVTTSVKVAESFEKEHKNVMRDIDTINNTLESQGVSRLNFEPSDYCSERGKKYPMFIMDRDAFSMLVFGFNGAKAMKFKMDYIRTFNELELEVMKSKAGLIDLTDITLA